MGLGFMFRLDESSIAGHIGERAPRTAADTESVAITEAGRRDFLYRVRIHCRRHQFHT